jgi:hypothetical protein
VSQILFNTIGGSVRVNHNSDATVAILDNMISGNLHCIGNALGVSNQNKPNTVDGKESGQCADPSFLADNNSMTIYPKRANRHPVTILPDDAT